MARKAKPSVREAAFRLTATFEGGWDAVAGDFDGHILSYGPLQWNLGQGTLRPVLLLIPEPTLRAYLGKEFVEALKAGNQALVSFVRQNVLQHGAVLPEWRVRLRTLANTPEARLAFLKGAEPYFGRAESLLGKTGWETERAYALAFDTAVQNGAPRNDHLREYAKRLGAAGSPPEEWKRLKIWASVVADLANPRWRQDVLARKLTIAVGRGVVHGRRVDLEKDYNISYERKWFEEEAKA